MTAMLVVTLAAVITSSLFYRESVAVRSIENRLAMSQTRWVERAAIDWAKVILRSDTNQRDHASEVWGTPVVETRLDETVTGGARVGDGSGDAFLAGAIIDAQSRFNLTSLVNGGAPSPAHMTAMRKLMGLLGLPESLADQVVARILQSRATTLDDRMVPAQALKLLQVDDLRDLPGFDDDAMQALRPHVIVLPEPTPVNLNTASPEVIAAVIPDLSVSAARAFVQHRDRVPLENPQHATTQLGLSEGNPVDPQMVSVATRYFIVQGLIRYDRVESRTETLLRRNSPGARGGGVQVVWQLRN